MNWKLVKIDYIYVWKIITRIIHFYNQKRKRKGYIEKERKLNCKRGELNFLQDQLLLELIIQVYFSITFPAFNISMNRKLVKIDYIYVWKIITRIIHFYNQKRRRKGYIEKERKRWWSVESSIASKISPLQINNTSFSIISSAFNVSINRKFVKIDYIYENHENYSFL